VSKERNLDACAGRDGIIAALAIDQRSSLEKSLHGAGGTPNGSEALRHFKALVVEELSDLASAVLLDPLFGLAAAGRRAEATGLILAYEESGYDAASDDRSPSLLSGWSAGRLARAGANAVKLLLYYDPFDREEVNDRKQAFVERAGAECQAEGVPLFLEPLTYCRGLEGARLADAKAELVRRTVAEFSRERYLVDVLKIELPLPLPAPVRREGAKSPLWRRPEAERAFRELDAVASKPYIFLSGGLDMDQFVAALEMAGGAGAGYSGVLCGRATWKGAVPIFAREGPEAARAWLREHGAFNIERLNEVVRRHARPWRDAYDGSRGVVEGGT
jgi:tagatose 1,6-diphosphate aldolase